MAITPQEYYKWFLSLIPTPQNDVGTVVAISGDSVEIELLNGQRAKAKGVATIGSLVYIKDGVIIGPAASNIPSADIEV